MTPMFVIPAKAGNHPPIRSRTAFQILTCSWIPAFAGMTTVCEAITNVRLRNCGMRQILVSTRKIFVYLHTAFDSIC